MINQQTSKTVRDMITLMDDTLPDIIEAAEILALTISRQFGDRRRHLDPYGLIEDLDLRKACRLILDSRNAPAPLL